MAKTRVLVVEDNESQQELYKNFFRNLHEKEFIGVLAKNGEEAFTHLRRHPSPPVDAVILDWCLPDTNGLTILRHIRSSPVTRNIVVFMVTGNIRDKDSDTALAARADDYITKPFREQELYLKLRNHLDRKKTVQEEPDIFTLDGLRLVFKAKTVTLDRHAVHLKPKEFDLLVLLLERPGIVHAQGFLADSISTASDETSPDAVRQHIYDLRKKLGAWGERIEARYGQGYVLHAKPPISQD